MPWPGCTSKILTKVILLQVRHTAKRWKWTGDWNWSQKRDQVEMKGRVREGCFGGRGLLPDIWGDESGSSRKRGWRRCFSPLLLCFFRHMVVIFSISPICPCHGFLAAFFRQFWYSRIKSLDILLQIRTWRYRNADKKIPFMVQLDITLEASILPFQTSFVKPKTDRQISVIPPPFAVQIITILQFWHWSASLMWELQKQPGCIYWQSLNLAIQQLSP